MIPAKLKWVLASCPVSEHDESGLLMPKVRIVFRLLETPDNQGL